MQHKSKQKAHRETEWKRERERQRKSKTRRSLGNKNYVYAALERRYTDHGKANKQSVVLGVLRHVVVMPGLRVPAQ